MSTGVYLVCEQTNECIYAAERFASGNLGPRTPALVLQDFITFHSDEAYSLKYVKLDDSDYFTVETQDELNLELKNEYLDNEIPLLEWTDGNYKELLVRNEKAKEACAELNKRAETNMLEQHILDEARRRNIASVTRAFWRRIYPFRNEFGKELPETLPIQFDAHMSSAMYAVELNSNENGDVSFMAQIAGDDEMQHSDIYRKLYRAGYRLLADNK